MQGFTCCTLTLLSRSESFHAIFALTIPTLRTTDRLLLSRTRYLHIQNLNVLEGFFWCIRNSNSEAQIRISVKMDKNALFGIGRYYTI